MSSPEPNDANLAGDHARSVASGCWSIALIVIGALIALVSGLCVGGGLLATVLDLMRGVTPPQNALGVTFMYLLVSGPFLAGGVALIVWGVLLRKRRNRGPDDRGRGS